MEELWRSRGRALVSAEAQAQGGGVINVVTTTMATMAEYVALEHLASTTRAAPGLQQQLEQTI